MRFKLTISLPVGLRSVECDFEQYAFPLPQNVFCVTGNLDLKPAFLALCKHEKVLVLPAHNTVPPNSLVVVYLPETEKSGQATGKFISELNQQCETTGSVAIVFTHSPYALREVIRTRILVLDERYNHVLKPRLRTLGADIGAIDTFVLAGSEDGMGSTLGAYADSKTPISTELEQELASEAYMALRRKLETKP